VFRNSASGNLTLTGLGKVHHCVGVRPGDHALVVTHTTPGAMPKTSFEHVRQAVYADVASARKTVNKGVGWINEAEHIADEVAHGAGEAAHIVGVAAKTVQRVAGNNNKLGQLAGGVAGLAAVAEDASKHVAMEIESLSNKTQAVQNMLARDPGKKTVKDIDHADVSSSARAARQNSIRQGILKAARARLAEKRGMNPPVTHLADVTEDAGDRAVQSVDGRANAAASHAHATTNTHPMHPGNNKTREVHSAAGVHHRTDARKGPATHK